MVNVLSMLMLGASKQKVTEKISILISKHGKAAYLPAEGKKQKIRPGALLLNTGKIDLGKDASVLIYSNGQYIQLKDKGEYPLQQVVRTGEMQKLNFDARFSRYLMAAVDLVVHAKDGDGWGELSGSQGGGDGWGELSGSQGGGDGWGELSGSQGGGDGWGELSGSQGGGDGWGELSGSQGGGDGWGELSGSQGGGDGWGDKDGRIVPILPFGKIPEGPIVFQWTLPRGKQSHVLEILGEDGGIVHSTEVRDNWAQINVDSLSLKPGLVYAWRIDVPDHHEITSTKARFGIADQEAAAITGDKLKNSEGYKFNDPVLSSLMEAVVLEEADHFYEAHQRYETVLQSDKKNNLAKLMQAAFYLRYNLKPRAQRLFK